MFHSFSVLMPPCGPSRPQNAASEAMARCESMPLKCLPTAKPMVRRLTFGLVRSIASSSTIAGCTPVTACIFSAVNAFSSPLKRSNAVVTFTFLPSFKVTCHVPLSAGSMSQSESVSRSVSTWLPSLPGMTVNFFVFALKTTKHSCSLPSFAKSCTEVASRSFAFRSSSASRTSSFVCAFTRNGRSVYALRNSGL